LWIYSIGATGFKHIPENIKHKFKLRTFKLKCWGAALASLCLLVWSPYLDSASTKEKLYALSVFIIFLVFCVQTIVYASKTITTVYYKRPVVFFDVFKYSLTFMVFTFGVWYIQPKVNQIFDDGDDD
jgi:hypothetical protein